jgi:hypothetical protein
MVITLGFFKENFNLLLDNEFVFGFDLDGMCGPPQKIKPYPVVIKKKRNTNQHWF